MYQLSQICDDLVLIVCHGDTWQTDVPKKSAVVAKTSTNHSYTT